MVIIPAGVYEFNDTLEAFGENGENVEVMMLLPFKIVPFELIGDTYNGIVTADQFNVLICNRFHSDDANSIMLGYANVDGSFNPIPVNLYIDGVSDLSVDLLLPCCVVQEDVELWDPAYININFGNGDPVYFSPMLGDGIKGAGKAIEVLTDTLVRDDYSGRWFLNNTRLISKTEDFLKPEKLLAIVQSVINKANEVTDKYDTNLTSAVYSLIEKYDNVSTLPQAEDYAF